MVGKVCTVCRNGSYLNKNLSFFSYPGDPERRYQWLNAVHRLDLLSKLSDTKTRANHRICEVHFLSKYIKQSPQGYGRKYLTRDAFPTLFLNNPNGIIIQKSSTEKVPVQSGYRKRDNKYTIEVTKIDEEPANIKVEKREPKGLTIAKPDFYTDISKLYESVLTVANSSQSFENNLANAMLPGRTRRSKNAQVKAPDCLETQRPVPGFTTDISALCESVIKVSKGTQTFDESVKSKFEDTECTIKICKMENGNSEESFLTQCNDILPSGLAQIVKWSLNPSNNRNLHLLALYLYHSGNAYDIVKNFLNLPTVDNLKEFLIPKSTKVDDNIHAFKAKVSNMSTKERICSIAVGKIKLKTSLYYNIKFDRILGFHDMDGKQLTKPAEFVLIVVAQGIVENWVQPIACCFVSDEDSEVQVWIEHVIKQLMDIGLEVKAFVSDLRCEYAKNITPDIPVVLINGKTIFYVYDVNQLLEAANYSLLSVDGHHESNFQITNVEFCNKIQDLCNILNAKSSFAPVVYKREKEDQVDFLKEMISHFENLKEDRKIDDQDFTKKMNIINYFLITINSFLQLIKELQCEGIQYLATNRLSHNFYLDNFFRRLNTEHGECTGRQFNKCFTRGFVFNMLKKPNNSKKCRADNSFDLATYSDELMNTTESHDEDSHTNTPLRVFTTDYRDTLPEKNAFVYLCGYLYFKCLQIHRCEKLSTFSEENQESQTGDDNSFLCSVSVIQNRIILPPDRFNEYIKLLELEFTKYLQTEREVTSIGHEVLKQIEGCTFDMPCPCFPVDYLKSLFVRVVLFYTIRKNNKYFGKHANSRSFQIFSL